MIPSHLLDADAATADDDDEHDGDDAADKETQGKADPHDGQNLGPWITAGKEANSRIQHAQLGLWDNWKKHFHCLWVISICGEGALQIIAYG